jgi:hypothetical protein
MIQLPTGGAPDTGEADTFFRVQELQEPGTIRVMLRGQMSAEHGAEHELTAKGGAYVPLGSAQALLTANAIELANTEYTFDWSAKYMRPQHCEVDGFDLTFTPEGLVELFQTIAVRSRMCLVELPGGFARRGLLRSVKAKPNRGYSVYPRTGRPGTPGSDQEVTLTFAWSSLATPTPGISDRLTGEDAAGSIADATDAIASAANDPNPFGLSPFEQISNAIGNVRLAGAQLRGVLKKVGDIAKAPAVLALSLVSAAKSFNNALNDLRDIISDTPELYLSAGDSFESLTKLRNTNGKIKRAIFVALDATASIFDAIDGRRARVVRVRPGQSLLEIAKREVGNADQWQAIGSANGIAGRFVPDDFVTIEIPSGLGGGS